MASASTCWVLITRRRAILHMCCRLAMLRGHSQKCTLPSRVLKHKSKGEKTENWANISESSKCSKVVQGSWGKKWWGFLIESQDVPRCSLTSNVCVCVLTEHRQHVVASYPAARTLPWAEKAQQRPLETEAIARGALSSMLQKRTSLCREKQTKINK